MNNVHRQPAAAKPQQPRFMTRPQKQAYALQFTGGKEARGLEIGCSFQPLFRRSEGYNVQYLETTDTAGVRARCAAAKKPLSLVEEIDFVFDPERTLAQTVGGAERYDYAVTSHVVEHIPNLAGHLNEVESVLRPGGVYVAIVPDKNFCFDVVKPNSTLGEVLEAHVAKRKAPPFASYVDEMRYASKTKDVPYGGWTNAQAGDLIHKYPDRRTRILNAIKEQRAPPDWYGHTWAFTPVSFVQLYCDLLEFNVVTLDCVAVRPTFNMDFVAVFKKQDAHTSREKLLAGIFAAGYGEHPYFKSLPIDLVS